MGSLAQQHDCLLLDLDGTLFRGHAPTEGAVAALEATDTRALFVTNNASRAAGDVALKIRASPAHKIGRLMRHPSPNWCGIQK